MSCKLSIKYKHFPRPNVWVERNKHSVSHLGRYAASVWLVHWALQSLLRGYLGTRGAGWGEAASLPSSFTLPHIWPEWCSWFHFCILSFSGRVSWLKRNWSSFAHMTGITSCGSWLLIVIARSVILLFKQPERFCFPWTGPELVTLNFSLATMVALGLFQRGWVFWLSLW